MSNDPSPIDPWAAFRFSVIGPLLASPPPDGELGPSIQALAEKSWQHPTVPKRRFTVGSSTIERWYYTARDAQNPIEALARKVRCDAGRSRALSSRLLAELSLLYQAHPSWSYQLHFDNLDALVNKRPDLGSLPSYNTVRRTMHAHGWLRRKQPKNQETKGQLKARLKLETREVRSFEATHVHGLWHSDFHHGSLKVVDAQGNWHTPFVVAILDDKSRLCCHIQWYLAETTENFIHALTQAFYKRGLPRELLTDNGGPFVAAETENGCERTSILHPTTLPYSPYQNAKQENFWATLEGRLVAMVENVKPLTLDFLNRATFAWAELEYNRAHHSEIGTSPIEAAVKGPSVARPSPDAEALTLAFCDQQTRTQRKSDGTLSLMGVRFELPNRLRTLRQVTVRFKRWDLTKAFVVDPRTKALLARITPLDKAKNANGARRALTPPDEQPEAMGVVPVDPVPPLLRQLMDDFNAYGLVPAYLPKDETGE